MYLGGSSGSPAGDDIITAKLDQGEWHQEQERVRSTEQYSGVYQYGKQLVRLADPVAGNETPRRGQTGSWVVEAKRMPPRRGSPRGPIWGSRTWAILINHSLVPSATLPTYKTRLFTRLWR